MRVSTAAFALSAITVASSLLATPAVAAPSSLSSAAVASSTASSSRPTQFIKVSAESSPGNATFHWSHDGRNTTGYVLETALTPFSKSSSSSLPTKGRHDRVWAIPASARSFTLSGDQLAAAGAPAGSGNYLYYRLYARNANGKGVAAERAFPNLGAVMPETAKVSGTGIRIASFNVRTARATSDSRPWLTRRTDVAAEIIDRAPKVVALQELGPGRADGKTGTTNGAMRQTTSLLDSLQKQGAGNYRLVRSTPYVEPGKATATQGMRLLYDSDRVSLVSDCSEKTGKRNYSSDCSFDLPLLPGDSAGLRRHAAYAEFRDLSSGKRFYVVSAHFDVRHSKNAAKEKSYTKLRAQQMQTIVDKMAAVNTGDLPLVVAGDTNSWQTVSAGNGPHDTLVDNGFSDTAAAPTALNLQYSTFNGFATTQHLYKQGFGSRLDVIMTKGFAGATRFENVTKGTDRSRASDHNMIVADTVL
ncbi:endonuclease/exonuclease/phosphatase family protein [uncultured Friedmanniella sp.]|uniref:endonuclease/exonuclease/phosphatase family protein n=1 Tax=uncultured Friedmanniella sp. TaxID=335381 RepID=UPI0035CB719E